MTKAVKIESPKLNKPFTEVWSNPNYGQNNVITGQIPQQDGRYAGVTPFYQAVAPLFSGHFGLNTPVATSVPADLIGQPQLNPYNGQGLNQREQLQLGQLAQNGFLGVQQIPLGGRAPLTVGARTALSQGSVTYYDADHETIIECKFPGINAKNLTLTIIGDTLRIRQKTTTSSKSKGSSQLKKTTESCEFLALPIPPLTEITQIKAMAEKDRSLKIVLPRLKEVRQNIREVRIS